MFARSPIAFFLSFLVLLGHATAAKLFCMDARTPAAVRAAGGLALARSGAKSAGAVYIYTIDPKSPNKLGIVDLNKEFKKAGEENPHPREKEFSVHKSIP